MGVSIGWQTVIGRTHWITPGWRSMMHQLLIDNDLYGDLDRRDIPLLLKVGREQRKGIAEPPFDYADDIRKAFQSIARAIRRHGTVRTVYEF